MKKKRILVIAPACLPITGAEAIVNAKLLSALSKDGRFDIDLISKIVRTGPYPSNPNYEDFGITLNKNVQIEVDNQVNFKTIIGHFQSLFKFGTVIKGSHWAVKALKTAESWVRNTDYDYVLTKNYPSLLIGYYLKKKYGKKWIATWNDPFPNEKYPFPYGKGSDAKVSFMANRMIKIMREGPDIHIFPSERLRDYMMKYLILEKSKTIVLPHVILPSSLVNRKSDTTLRLLHSGNLGHPRDPKKLLKAFRLFLEREPNARITLSFIGKIEQQDAQLISELGINSYISILPPIPYEESIKELDNYDVAIVLEAECDEGIFLPTKVSDFMERNIPIFAISPKEGTLNDFYREGYISYFADNLNINAIATQISELYADYISGNIKNQKIKEDFLASSISNHYYNF